MPNTPIADLIEAMSAAAAPIEAIILAVRAVEGLAPDLSADTSADALERRREKDRERKRFVRSQGRNLSATPSADIPQTGSKGVGVSSSLSSNVIEVKEVSKTPLPPKPSADKADSDWAIDEWNRMAKAHGLAPVQSRNPERVRATQARLKECGGRDGWAAALVLVTQSPGLLGENDRGWKMDFDAFTSKKKFTKLMEGGYANWKPHNNGGTAFSQASAAINERIAERGFDFGHNGNRGPDDKTPPY